MKKKILHIISSLKRGGAESLLVDLLAELTEYDHHVIYFYEGPNKQRLEKIGIKTYQIKGFFFFYDLLFFARLLRLIKHVKPDCIHSTLWAANFFGRIIAKLLTIPLVSVVHLSVNQDGSVRNFIDSQTFRYSKKVVAVSAEVADSLHKKTWISAQQISVISNGISSNRIKEEAILDCLTLIDLDIPSNAFVVGSVGRFIERKNFSLLLRAFANLVKNNNNAYLILVGFGPLENDLRTLATLLDLDKKVRFVIGRSAYGVYPIFDCFVLPSFQEGMSIALLEAMCFALPCIVTSAGMDHEVIESGKNGLVIHSGNQAALTEKLMLLVFDVELRKTLGKNALRSINEKFSMEIMAEKYRKVFFDFLP